MTTPKVTSPPLLRENLPNRVTRYSPTTRRSRTLTARPQATAIIGGRLPGRYLVGEPPEPGGTPGAHEAGGGQQGGAVDGHHAEAVIQLGIEAHHWIRGLAGGEPAVQ